MLKPVLDWMYVLAIKKTDHVLFSMIEDSIVQITQLWNHWFLRNHIVITKLRLANEIQVIKLVECLKFWAVPHKHSY